MKKINRTLIGIIAIVLAAIISFFLVPRINKLSTDKISVVRVKNNVSRGHIITGSDIETTLVSKDGVPENVLLKEENVVGKYAKCDLFPGDYVFETKIAIDSLSASDVLSSLDGRKRAISITVQSFAGGLSGKLENGDIVEVVVYKNDKSEIYPELKYVQVITTTTAEGIDKDSIIKNEDGTYDQPITATLLVNEEQAKILVSAENNGKIHLLMVYRGTKENSDKFLEAQEEYFIEKQKNANSLLEDCQ